MKIQLVFVLSLVAMGILAGCSKSESDASPLPAGDPQARLQKAQEGVESSNMTPEQKQAAADYLAKGAQGAQRMRESAERAGQAGGK